MKRQLILVIGFLLVNSGRAQIRVTTYNIRYENTIDAENAVSTPKQAMADSLQSLHDDIICMQEVLNSQYRFLRENLSGYASYGIGRDNGREAGEYAPVFFLRSKYRLIDSGTFWLSETPEKPSRGW